MAASAPIFIAKRESNLETLLTIKWQAERIDGRIDGNNNQAEMTTRIAKCIYCKQEGACISLRYNVCKNCVVSALDQTVLTKEDQKSILLHHKQQTEQALIKIKETKRIIKKKMITEKEFITAKKHEHKQTEERLRYFEEEKRVQKEDYAKVLEQLKLLEQ